MDQILRPFLTFLSVGEKKLAVVERLFWQLGTQFSSCCHCREVAIVEGSKQEPMHEQKKVGVVERWPSLRGLNKSHCYIPRISLN